MITFKYILRRQSSGRIAPLGLEWPRYFVEAVGSASTARTFSRSAGATRFWNSCGATLHSLIWRSIANFARAIWSNFASTKYALARESWIERQSFKRRQADPCNSRQTAASLEVWLRMIQTTGSRYLFPSRLHARPHLSTRQYSRLVHRWVDSIGLESISYGTHSMRRTKATQIYRKTGNLRAVQRSWRAPSDISGLRWMTL